MNGINTVRRRHPSRLLSWFIRFSHRREIHGLRVAVFEKNAALESVFDKIREALELVRSHDARAFRELVEHTGGIFVFGTTGGDAAEWWRDESLIVLEPEYAADPTTTSRALAVIFVHETTHAWLERRGFEYAVDRRMRLERICDRRALRLARRLPDSEYLVTWLEQEPRPAEELTDEAFHQRAVAQLVRLGMPRWLLRQMEAWSKRWYRMRGAHREDEASTPRLIESSTEPTRPREAVRARNRRRE
jgi:hypothetical protein